jgi:hypothetical protein
MFDDTDDNWRKAMKYITDKLMARVLSQVSGQSFEVWTTDAEKHIRLSILSDGIQADIDGPKHIRQMSIDAFRDNIAIPLYAAWKEGVVALENNSPKRGEPHS